jgi:polysaccharide export outer membrane protein
MFLKDRQKRGKPGKIKLYNRLQMSRRLKNLKAAALPLCLVFAAFTLWAQVQIPPSTPPATEPVTPATPPPQPTQPSPSTTPNAANTANAAPSAAGAPVDSNSYKVGPADVLLIRVWNEPAFTGPVAVQQNGKITLQLLGDIQAGGKTPVEIQEDLSKALTKFVVHPLVTVTVADVGSKRYYMDGLIARPGEYPLGVPTTILQAISRAGGIQEFANSKRIYVLRGDKRIYFNYKDVIKGKHLEENILLQPDDHIVVP